ncbi:hypothetical protein [Spongiactinospora sp. 9N601]|uniref:hypothetical protein n=1 Tax=Spongiactinospora sp. 9N601 TaxID=3375149 RepID=UPI00379BA480
MANGVASAEATGGAGTIFEYRVAALALSRLLRGAHPPVGPHRPIITVALQQRIAGSLLDDVVVRAGSTSLSTTIEFQVKKTLSVTGSSRELISVLGQAVETWRQRPDDLESGRLILGIAAGGPEAELNDLAQLASKARGHHTAASFRLLLSEYVTSRQLRSRYEHLVTALSTATGITEQALVEVEAHRVLSRLHVWTVDPTEDGRDWRQGLDDARALADASGMTASDLLGKLTEFAQTIGPNAGNMDADAVRASFRSKFAVDLAAAAPAPNAATINARHEGSGSMIVGQTMTFHGLTINTHIPGNPPS